MADEETLAQIAVSFVADTTQLDAAMNGIISRSQYMGGRAGASFGGSYRSGVLNAIAGLNNLVGGGRTLLATLGDVTGSNVAAQYGYLRRQLVGITGDANQAERAFQRLRKVAADTNFDLDQVFGLTVKIGGRTGDMDRAVKDTQAIVDAATAFGVQNNMFDAFQKNIGDTLGRGEGKVSVVDVRQFLRYGPQFVSQIAKAEGVSTPQAYQQISRSSGNELYNLILRVGERNRGAAAQAAAQDPQSIARNITDDARNAIEPTGRLINTLLIPPLMFLRNVLQGWGRINELTHGFAGFTGLLVAGTLYVRRFGLSAITAFGSVNRLATSLNVLAASANRATTATATQAAGGTLASGFGSYGRLAGGINTALGTGEQLAMGLTDPVDEKVADRARDLVGRIFGERAKKLFGGGDGASGGGTRDDNTAAVKDLTEQLKQTKFSGIGGGGRFNGALRGAELEAQYALLRSMNTGIG